MKAFSSATTATPLIALVATLTGCGGNTSQEATAEPAPVEPHLQELVSGTDAVLQALSPVNEQLVWVSGHAGVILRTTDGGDSWERIPGPAGDSLQFRDIHGADATRAWILSAGEGPVSRIYGTRDGGSTWELQFLMDNPAGFLDCFDFWPSGIGFAYGDSFDGSPYILRTEDGTQWTRVPADQLPAAGEGEGGFAASGTCARVGSDGTGWIGTGAGGSARILSTGDYGSSWSVADTPMEKGATAGVFAMATWDGHLVLALGGNLQAEGVVSANAIVPQEDRWETASPAPVPGAVYGAGAAAGPTGPVVFAVAPTGGAFTEDLGITWTPLGELQAWAVDFAPGRGTGWAGGAEGRLWRITLE